MFQDRYEHLIDEDYDWDELMIDLKVLTYTNKGNNNEIRPIG